MKERLEAIKKMEYKQLVKEKNGLVSKYLLESAKLAASGIKNTKKTKDVKKEISWVETFINKKIYIEADKV
jgi:ribosomal protein L29